jgi:hypothetical protein
LTWEAWKQVKSLLIRATGNQAIQSLIEQLAEIYGETDGDVKEVAKLAGQRVVTTLTESVGVVVSTMDEITDLIIANCVETSVAGLTPKAALKLRDAVLEISDVAGLLVLEKNSVADLIKNLRGPQATNPSNNGAATSSTSTGTSPGSPN